MTENPLVNAIRHESPNPTVTNGLLLPYQFNWVFDDSAAVLIYEKSRRIGISWATACKAVLVAMAANGMDVWYVGYNKEMAQEFIRDCAFWVRQFSQVAEAFDESVVDDEGKDILNFGIKLSSGFRITALSSKPANLRGKQGLVILDEAAFHDQLSELLKAALALLIWGGRLLIISTHDGVDNPFNNLCEEVKAKKKPYKLHRTTFGEAVDEGLYKRICQMRGLEWTAEKQQAWVDGIYDEYGHDAAEELDVIPSNSGGAVLSRALLLSRAQPVPVIRLEKPNSFAEYPEHLRRAEIADWCETELLPHLEKLNPERAHCFGEDFARSGDLTVIAPLVVEQNTHVTAPFVVELSNIPYSQQEQILFYIVDRIPRLRGGALDATGNGEYLAEKAQQRYGSGRIAAVKLNNPWYSENMPPFIAAFEDDGITIPKDDDIISDLRALQRIDGIIKLPKGKTDSKNSRHGDAAIAYALAYTASLIDVVEYAYEAVPRVESNSVWEADENGWYGWRRGAI